MTASFDCAIVGSGVLGLAHAYHFARQGKKVLVLERSPRPQGASIRNFGMLWPIGQPDGPLTQLALRSVEIWKELLDHAGLWYDPCGSLHVAYHDDEAAVLQEFIARTHGRALEWLSPAQVKERSPGIRLDGLRGGMFSRTEICVDAPRVIGALPAFLQQRYGISFEFHNVVLGYDRPSVRTSHGIRQAEQLIVCNGADFRNLYPEAFAELGVVLCKLQMMRTPSYADRFRLGPMLAAGLTLVHYKAFQGCPTLPALKQRFERELPLYLQYGIHVMASQNSRGELVLGDSHEYGDDAIEPFDKEWIDQLILDYLFRFLEVPDFRIEARWHGIYAKHSTEHVLIRQPADGVTTVNAVGGAGMTLSFGIAEQVVAEVTRR